MVEAEMAEANCLFQLLDDTGEPNSDFSELFNSDNLDDELKSCQLCTFLRKQRMTTLQLATH